MKLGQIPALLATLALTTGTASVMAQTQSRDGNESAQGADAVRSGTTVNLLDYVEVDRDPNPYFDPLEDKAVFERVEEIKRRLTHKNTLGALEYLRSRSFKQLDLQVGIHELEQLSYKPGPFDFFIRQFLSRHPSLRLADEHPAYVEGLRLRYQSILTWAFTDSPLPEIDDAGVIKEFKPGVSGKPTQLAIQANGVVLVHRPFWLALSTEDKAGLVIHELMIRVLLLHRVDLNTPVGTGPLRELNRLAASADWEKAPDRWYQEVLERLLKHPVSKTIPTQAGATTQIKGDYYQVVITDPVIRVERDNPWGRYVTRISEVPLSQLAGGEFRPAVTLAHLEHAEAELAREGVRAHRFYSPLLVFTDAVCRSYGFDGIAEVYLRRGSNEHSLANLFSMFEGEATPGETIVVPFDSGFTKPREYVSGNGTVRQVRTDVGYDSIAGLKATPGKHLILKSLICARGHFSRN